jgi:hypothetical protein
VSGRLGLFGWPPILFWNAAREEHEMPQTSYVKITTAANQTLVATSKNRTMDNLLALIGGIMSGRRGKFGGSLEIHPACVAAAGTLTLAAAAGTVGVTINGVAVTVAFAVSDTATATALAAAIVASVNDLVGKHVTATSLAGVVTITSKIPGFAGNAVTIVASGTGATASGARLTGGTEGNSGSQNF